MSTIQDDYTVYIKEQEARLRIEQWVYKKASARELRRRKAYGDKLKEYQSLVEYFTNIGETDQLARKVIYSIEETISLIKRAACNAELTSTAIMYLIVQVEEVSHQVVELQQCIDQLKQDIRELSAPPADNSAIMKAINKLAEAINDALTEALQCLLKILEALQLSMLIHKQLGDPDCHEGLTKFLVEMLYIIRLASGDDSKLKFPREECPQDYYDHTRDQKEEAERMVRRLLRRWNRAKEFASLAKAKVQARQKAIDAAKAASVC